MREDRLELRRQHLPGPISHALPITTAPGREPGTYGLFPDNP
jgi:hypothetical protein